MRTIELEDNQIAIIWSVEDVMVQCEWLTEEQALDVLYQIEHKHDATMGINWDVIHYTAEWMFPEPMENDNG